MPRLILPLQRTSPLAYPGRAPGFDPSHPASTKICYSGVPNNTAIVNLLNGQPPVFTSGAFTAPIDGNIGPSIGWGSATGTSHTQNVTAGRADTPTQVTIAAIARFATLGNFNAIFNDGLNSEVVGLYVDSSNVLMLRVGTTNVLSSLAITAGVPYFLAASINQATSVNFVLLRLDTGLLRTQTVSSGGLTMGASNTVYMVGQREFGDFAMTGNLAAVMYNHSFLSAPQLRQWAQDPWAFWYPRTLDLATMLGTASGGGNIFSASVTEAGSASEVESVIATFAAADSESGIAVDTPSASAVFAASDTEAGTATDTPTGSWVTSSTITEAGTAADSESVTASFASSITEANSAADSYVNTAVFVASDAEAGSASDSPSSTAIFAASDAEAASAADSESSTGAVISDGVIEAATAAETEAAIVTFAAAASEAGSATDASSNVAVFSAAASEAGNANDTEDANGVFVASDTEAATATDLSNGIIPGPPSTDGPHSNPFFATPGPMTTVQ